MDKEGDWLVVAKIAMDGQMIYLVRRVKIVAAKNVADEAFKNARTASYPEYFWIMHQERVKRGGADLDQSKTKGAYITNEGPSAANPRGRRTPTASATRSIPTRRCRRTASRARTGGGRSRVRPT